MLNRLCILLILQITFQRPTFSEEILYRSVNIGQTQQGRSLNVDVVGTGREVLVILSSIHGTETIGTPLCNQLLDRLVEHPEWIQGKTLYIVRMANPDGMVEGLRGNRHNIDINRNFPTDNFGRGWFNGDEPLTASESEVLMTFFQQINPARVLTIHQPLNGIDFDGPSKELATALSDASGIRIHRLGSRSGSLGSFVGVELGVPIVTLEVPGYANQRSSQWLWQKYGVLLQTFLLYSSANQQSN